MRSSGSIRCRKARWGPTRRILGDLEGLATAGGFPVFEYAIADRAELSELFRQLTTRAEQGLRPVLNVDAHGTVAEGLLLAPSGERVGWGQIIEDLRALNVATGNNLTCIFALCFGLHLYTQVSLKRPEPSYLFFAPPAEINVSVLEAQTLAFYREMNRTSNMTAAFKQTLGEAMESFHCQGLFLLSLLGYSRTYCIGRMRHDRLERMVTAVLQQEGSAGPSTAQLKQFRRQIRESETWPAGNRCVRAVQGRLPVRLLAASISSKAPTSQTAPLPAEAARSMADFRRRREHPERRQSGRFLNGSYSPSTPRT